MELTREQVVVIVDRIERKLVEKGIGKLDFYKNSGVASATFSQWKSGLRNPTVQSLDKIAKYLNVPLEWIISGAEGDKDDSAQAREILRDRPEMKILFDAAKDVPASKILETAASLWKYKEESQGK